MAKYTNLKNQLRSDTRIDTAKYRLTAKQWALRLKDHPDEKIRNLGYGLEYGIRTGRLPNHNYDYEITDPKTYKPLTNLQMITAFAKAALDQSELTTAAGCNALQAAFGLKRLFGS